MADLNGKRVLVGAGGWYEYKKDESLTEPRLRAYSREFDFVELNQTFYNLVHPSNLEYSRKIVPRDFEFSVKCYKGLTHEIGLRPVEDAFRLFAMMQEYCEILDSKVLVLQFPPTLKLDDKFVEQAKEFFKSIKFGSLHLACEFRVTTERMPERLVAMLHDFNMSHTVDLTFEDPLTDGDILYTRVFGRPEKQNSLDDADLQVLKKKVEKSKASNVRVVGHSLKMIEDTRRIKEAFS